MYWPDCPPDCKAEFSAKNTNANTIIHYVPQKAKNLEQCREAICKTFPHAEMHTQPVAIVSVIGMNMKNPGFLARAAKALYEENINVLALDQVMRQISIQFIVEREDFKEAQIALHLEFFEKGQQAFGFGGPGYFLFP